MLALEVLPRRRDAVIIQAAGNLRGVAAFQRLHPTIRNKLAVDPEAADVIRRIFREALEGSNTSQIARSLNDDGIDVYKRQVLWTSD